MINYFMWHRKHLFVSLLLSQVVLATSDTRGGVPTRSKAESLPRCTCSSPALEADGSKRACFTSAIGKVGPTVFLVVGRNQEAGDDHPLFHGTAFNVSRKHRLLATAAHVADG